MIRTGYGRFALRQHPFTHPPQQKAGQDDVAAVKPWDVLDASRNTTTAEKSGSAEYLAWMR